MQDEHLGFWSFPIFFPSVALGNNFSTLNQAFIKKHLGKRSSKTVPMGTRSKTLFLTSTTAVDTQQMSKMQSRRWLNQKLFNHYYNAKISQSICSIHQIICEMQLILESHMIVSL